MSWLKVPSIGELTPEQQAIINAPNDRNLLVFGPPGSGKTITLLYRAHALRQRYNVSTDRFLIVVFTRVLSGYIQSMLDLLDLPELCIRTFDSWCWRFHQEHFSSPPTQDSSRPDFAQIRKDIKTYLEKRKLPKQFDFLLIDEGQDLDENAFKIATLISNHITVCGDDKQQLYENRTNTKKIERILATNQRPIQKRHLLYGFRCTKFIVQLAAEFIDAPEEKLNFLAQHPEFLGTQLQPLLYEAKTQEDELQSLVENIQVRLAQNERIAILVPSGKLVPSMYASLSGAGIDVESTKRIVDQFQLDCGYNDFASQLPKIMPYPSAKGLTLDSVFMPFLESQHFHVDQERIRRWIFVGISRTTQWLYFSARSNSIMFQEIFTRLAHESKLRINQSDLHTPGAITDARNEITTEKDDLSDLF